jgi:oligopeptide/dipeptide ABC transporter ATP-binding protein
MGMILVTHDLGVVANRTDEIAVMYAGRIVEQAPTTELFAHTRMPYTEALLRSIPRLAEPSHTRLRAIPGRPPDLAANLAGCRFAPRCPYVQDRCRSDEPPLRNAGHGHVFRCWYPVGSREGDEALARNVAARVPAALAFTGAPVREAVLAAEVGSAPGNGPGAPVPAAAPSNGPSPSVFQGVPDAGPGGSPLFRVPPGTEPGQPGDVPPAGPGAVGRTPNGAERG